MAAKKTVLKFRREEEEVGCEVLMSRALYVEEVDEEDEGDEGEGEGGLYSQPPTDGMEYLRRVIKVATDPAIYRTFHLFFSRAVDTDLLKAKKISAFHGVLNMCE
jgi:hypothetical protein